MAESDDRATLNTSQFVPSSPGAGEPVSNRPSPIASMFGISGSRETCQPKVELFGAKLTRNGLRVCVRA